MFPITTSAGLVVAVLGRKQKSDGLFKTPEEVRSTMASCTRLGYRRAPIHDLSSIWSCIEQEQVHFWQLLGLHTEPSLIKVNFILTH
jgi:hypothetical protein